MLGAVNDFILKYAPNTTQNNIFRGYYNRAALPQKDSFIIVSMYDSLGIGTNVYKYDNLENGTASTEALREYTISIDFCNCDQSLAVQQVQNVAVIANSFLAVDFFKQYNLCLNYAEDIEYLPYTTVQEQYIHRYRVNLHITDWNTVEYPQEAAERVYFKHFENVDADHKVEEE